MLYKKSINKNLLVGALVLSTLAGTVGCVGKSVEGKELVQKGNKTITVIKDTKNIVPEEISISDIQEYKGVIGHDWVNANTVVVTKENDEVAPIETDFGSFNVQNLFSYDLNSKEEKSISDQSKFQMGAIVSPDKTHIFYKNEFSSNKIGYMADADGNRKLEIVDKNITDYDLSQASWVNDKELIMPCSGINGFVIANIDGTITKVNDVESAGMVNDNMSKYDILDGLSVLSPVKVENKIYYVTYHANQKDDKKLNVYDINTKEKKVLIKEEVLDFNLSPNKDQLLIVSFDENENENVLFTIDLEGNNKEVLASGHIYGQTWSNDQTKVAYLSLEEEEEGIYLVDINKKESTHIVAGEYFTPLEFSPEDEKIMVHSKMSKDNGKLFDEIDVTNIVSFK